MSKVNYFNCGKKGHIAPHCPEKEDEEEEEMDMKKKQIPTLLTRYSFTNARARALTTTPKYPTLKVYCQVTPSSFPCFRG